MEALFASSPEGQIHLWYTPNSIRIAWYVVTVSGVHWSSLSDSRMHVVRLEREVLPDSDMVHIGSHQVPLSGFCDFLRQIHESQRLSLPEGETIESVCHGLHSGLRNERTAGDARL